MIEKLLEEYKNSPVDAKGKVREQVALSLAKAASLNYGAELKTEEMNHLIDNLFACETPNYSPEGKPVLSIISLDDLEKTFFR
jgi:DNA mismatch repair protein MutL